MDIRGKVALITGAAGGIGKGAAEKCLEMGMKVAIADIQEELGQKTCEELSKLGECRFYYIDLRNMDEVKALVPKVVEDFGTIDVLINNAGVPNRLPVEDVTLQAYEDMFAIHVRSGFFLSQAVGPIMKEKRWGRIINLSSPRGIQPDLIHPLYGMCKAAVRSMTEYFAMAYARWNIRVNAVSPACIYTPMTEHYRGTEGHAKAMKQLPAGEYMEIPDLSNVIWFLISDDSLPVNGTTIEADMGVHLTSLLSFGQFEKQGHPTSYLEE
ncbi:MAG: SDR family oxidoreductase [Lachnospiraceae bacterium]|nr:SDR family oxidoreductase [Lachnospiraceae bacterium]